MDKFSAAVVRYLYVIAIIAIFAKLSMYFNNWWIILIGIIFAIAS